MSRLGSREAGSLFFWHRWFFCATYGSIHST